MHSVKNYTYSLNELVASMSSHLFGCLVSPTLNI